MKRRIALLLALALTLACALCLGAHAEDAATVSLSDEALTLAVGRSETLKATVSPKSARKAGVTFASSNEAIATVNAKGKVTAVSVGECDVTATSVSDPAASATVRVRVIIPVKKMTLSLEPEDVYVGTTAKLWVAYSPADATNQSATYTSSKPKIATIADDGTITGVSRGRTVMTAVSADGKAKATLRVDVGQRPESVSISEASVEIVVGKQATLKATVLPKNTDNKKVTWSSADESIATVDSRGRVKAISRGETLITATCEGAPEISASAKVSTIQRATRVEFASTVYQVLAGETVQLVPLVFPETTSDQRVTYKVRDRRIATVDENGLVTGVKGGKTTVYVTAADGSRKQGKATIEVIVPVTGVSYKRAGLRVGAGGYATFTATLQPKDATNKRMTWVSADESIASVTGTTNRFKVIGHKWGRTKVTGTTEDGGYSVTIDVNIGRLRKAVAVSSVSIRDGRPYLKLRNRSNLNITEVRFVMRGFDAQAQPIVMSTSGSNHEYLYGAYEYSLAPGSSTHHGNFTFHNHSNYPKMAVLQFAITGWSTNTGYYDDNNNLRYSYNISESNWEWIGSSDLPS